MKWGCSGRKFFAYKGTVQQPCEHTDEQTSSIRGYCWRLNLPALGVRCWRWPSGKSSSVVERATAANGSGIQTANSRCTAGVTAISVHVVFGVIVVASLTTSLLVAPGPRSRKARNDVSKWIRIKGKRSQRRCYPVDAASAHASYLHGWKRKPGSEGQNCIWLA